MDDTGQRVIAAGDRAVTQPADRVLEDRFTSLDRFEGVDELQYTDDGGGGGGGGSAPSVSLPPPWGKPLDARLEKVDARHPLQAAVDVVAGSKANKGMSFALVDLTTPGKRLYASLRDSDQRYIASMGKLCILFAAFQLRAAARAAAALVDVKTAKTPDKLFATLTRAWQKPIGRYFRAGKGADNSLPALARIFTATPSASTFVRISSTVDALRNRVPLASPPFRTICANLK